MKNLLFTLLITVTAFAGSIKEGTMQARSDGSNIIVQWGSSDESLVREYVVERSSGLSGSFSPLGVIPKKGSNSFYEYIDKSAFKTTGSVYQYRVKIILNNGGTEYSTSITVSHNVSSVKRTWGSLKAMFR